MEQEIVFTGPGGEIRRGSLKCYQVTNALTDSPVIEPLSDEVVSLEGQARLRDSVTAALAELLVTNNEAPEDGHVFSALSFSGSEFGYPPARITLLCSPEDFLGNSRTEALAAIQEQLPEIQIWRVTGPLRQEPTIERVGIDTFSAGEQYAFFTEIHDYFKQSGKLNIHVLILRGADFDPESLDAVFIDASPEDYLAQRASFNSYMILGRDPLVALVLDISMLTHRLQSLVDQHE